MKLLIKLTMFNIFVIQERPDDFDRVKYDSRTILINFNFMILSKI